MPLLECGGLCKDAVETDFPNEVLFPKDDAFVNPKESKDDDALDSFKAEAFF